jgi:hypothetical protein
MRRVKKRRRIMKIKTKICSKCKKEKPVTEFSPNKHNLDGLQSHCRSCQYAYKREYDRTLNGLVHKIYGQQKSNSKRRGHKPPAYTFDALYDWFLSQPNYKKLYDNWKNSGYIKDLTPSIDRLDDNKGYSFDNIQLITWQENRKKEQEKKKKQVNQYSLDGKYLKTYNSITDAAKNVNTTDDNISATCRNITQTAAGYQWRYLSDEFPVGKDIPPVRPRLKYKRKVKATFKNGKSMIFDSLKAAVKYFNCSKTAIKHRIKDKHTKFEQLKDVILEDCEEDIENG